MDDDTRPMYEVLALRYGTHADRVAYDNFLSVPDGGHVSADASMPIDFYIWLIRSDRHLVVVDTGFAADVAARRGRTMICPPRDGLRRLGVEPASVSDVVITHMHYDHAGNLDLFPSARFHLQETELGFCTGRGMCLEPVRRPFEVSSVTAAIQRLFAGQVLLHRGPAEVVPGVTVHPAGGHTPGLQVVRVPTKRGWIVLASDAAHLWANIRRRNPFPIVVDLPSMLEAYDVVEALADGVDHVIPGHDPEVGLRFPRSADGSNWICLHEPPIIGSTPMPSRGPR